MMSGHWQCSHQDLYIQSYLVLQQYFLTLTLALFISLGGPNDLFKKIKGQFLAKFNEFQQKFKIQMCEGLGGTYNGVTLRYILSSEDVLQGLRTILGGHIGEAVYQYLKATWNVYIMCMKTEIDPNYCKIIKQFKEKFLVVRKVLKVSWTLKIHCILGVYQIKASHLTNGFSL